MHQASTRSLRRLICGALAAGLTIATAPAVLAQNFPSKPVRLIVPYPAGGGTDAVARALGQKLSEAWGQPVLIDNRAGANGAIGSDFVAKSAPDGYTLLMVVPSHVVNPNLMKSLPYDTSKDFAPVTSVMKVPLVLVASAKAPWTTLQQFIADAKARPGKVSIGSSEGSSMLTGELLKQRAGIDLLPVPYKGSAPMMADLLGGHVNVGFIPVTSALGQLKSGAIRVLGVAATKRNAALADVPTFAEAGVPLESYSWTGLFAPAKTPPATLTKIHADVSAALSDAALRDKITQGAAELSLEKPDDFAKYISRELEQWAGVASRAGVKAE